MSKQLTMWCVFNPDEQTVIETLCTDESMSKLYFGIGEVWQDLEKQGYTCRKVRVTIEEVKP